jgi:3-hydroxyisobutyrate dehydrogenase-like beta-hydroxyacid dehydrogenase
MFNRRGDINMNIGFIGFGEAAFELASGLKSEGVTSFYAFDPMSDHSDFAEVIHKRAKEASTILLNAEKEVVEKSDLLFVAVPANKSLEVSKKICKYLKTHTIYIEVSAASPAIKQKINNEVHKTGALFVDIAMMGPLPTYKHRVPMLASGNGAERFIEVTAPWNMSIEKVGENAGEASSVKLLRSIFMKGIATLLIETFSAAAQYNVEELVHDSIVQTFTDKGFEEMVNRLVTGTAIHSHRRSLELEGSLEMLQSENLDAGITKATKQKLEMITRKELSTYFSGEVPADWKTVIAVLNKNKVSNLK